MNIKLSYIYIFIIFLFLALCFRLLLPFGSEPDFEHRVSIILGFSERLYLSVYKYVLEGYSWIPKCDVNYSMTSMTGTISNFMCGEDLLLKITRWFLQVAFYSSLVFSILFVSRFWPSNFQDSTKTDALLVSLIFPSLIYYSGVVAEEVFVLWVSLISLLFIRKPFIFLTLVFLVFYVEVGGGIILSLFIICLYFFRMIYTYWGLKGVELISIFFITICAFLGIKLLQLLTSFPIIGNKVSSIYYAYNFTSYSEVIDKYPILLRPIITFMSAIFMTSDGVKAIILYPIIGVGFIYLYYHHRRKAYKNGQSDIYLSLLATITFIVSIVFVLPGYTNAKYYIFTLPIFMYAALDIFGLRKVITFNVVCSFVVIIQLFFSRL